MHGGAVVLVVQGAGGIGKTILAAEFARVHEDAFAATAWVDVRGGDSSAGLLLQRLLVALGRPDPVVPDADANIRALSFLLEQFAIAGERALLILDNVDHPDAHFARLVNDLATMPGAMVLVTTRQRALAGQLDGEPIDVGRFTLEEAVVCLAHWLAQTPDRASDLTGLRRIAARLGELPLAVKLAGAYLRRHPRTSLDAYEGQLAELPGESLARTLEITLQILTSEEHALFVAAGACTESFTIAAIAAAAARSEEAALNGLDRLFDLSLVERPVADRYALHPILREVAQGRPGFEDCATRHADWVLSAIGDDAGDIEMIGHVAAELLTAAQLMDSRDARRLIALCRVGADLWCARGPWDHAEHLLRSAAEAGARVGDEHGALTMTVTCANILYLRGDSHEALTLLATVHTSAASGADSDFVRAQALHLEGGIHTRHHRLAPARSALQRALRFTRKYSDDGDRLGRRKLISVISNSMGLLEHASDNDDDALKWYARAWKIQKKLPRRGNSAALLTNQGQVYIMRNQFARGMALYDQALTIQRRWNLPAEIAMTLHAKGDALSMQGDDAGAEACYRESLDLVRAIGDASWIGENLYSLALLRQAQGQPQEANSLATEALPLFARTGEQNRIAVLRTLLAGTLPPP
jgi:tetratricopeptide (TPR) repeat protein